VDDASNEALVLSEPVKMSACKRSFHSAFMLKSSSTNVFEFRTTLDSAYLGAASQTVEEMIDHVSIGDYHSRPFPSLVLLMF
jgi:hypothetical protein